MKDAKMETLRFGWRTTKPGSRNLFACVGAPIYKTPLFDAASTKPQQPSQNSAALGPAIAAWHASIIRKRKRKKKTGALALLHTPKQVIPRPISLIVACRFQV